MKKKCVYISAASRGIGLAVALRFASNGYDVAISSRKASHLERAKEKILRKIPHARVNLYVGDLSNPNDQAAILEAMQEASFSPDIFVCSSGQPQCTSLDNIDHDTWLAETEMIQGQALFATKHFAPRMAERGYGRFIFLSSVWTKNPGKDYLAGSMARAGLYVLSKSIVHQYAACHVASFVINLGFVDTPLLRNMAMGRPYDAMDPAETETGRPWQEKYKEWEQAVPAKRLGAEKDLASLIVFLASEEAEYCNGSIFSFSGGMDKNIL